MAEGDLYWYRVSANVMARSAREAEEIVNAGLPPEVEGAIAPSHVCNVEDARVYKASVDWHSADPGPRPRGEENGSMIAILATSVDEVREILLGQFSDEQIRSIEPL